MEIYKTGGWNANYTDEADKNGLKIYDTPITVTGTLEIGSETDEETGFVSQLRVHADSIDS